MSKSFRKYLKLFKVTWGTWSWRSCGAALPAIAGVHDSLWQLMECNLDLHWTSI